MDKIIIVVMEKTVGFSVALSLIFLPSRPLVELKTLILDKN